MNTGIISRVKRPIGLFLLNHFFCMTRAFSIKRGLLRFAGIQVGKNTKVVGPVKCGNVIAVSIGDDCWIGSDLKLFGNGKVIIGSNCDFSSGISVLTGSHRIGGTERRAGEGVSFSVSVGSGSWIGANATLLGDCSIGLGCVIGACSLVNRDILDNTVAAGVPVKEIKTLEKLRVKQ